MAECAHATLRKAPEDPHPVCERCGKVFPELPREPIITDVYSRDYYRQGRPRKAAEWPEVDPVPEVLSTDPRPENAPGEPTAVRGLAAYAAGEGWLVRVGYGRSPERAQRVGTYKLTETFSVWAGAHPSSGWRFCAVYGHTVGSSSAWTWRSISIWRVRAYGRFTHATITDLYHFVEHHRDVKQAWFRAIKARVEQAAEDAKQRAKARPKKAKGESAR